MENGKITSKSLSERTNAFFRDLGSSLVNRAKRFAQAAVEKWDSFLDFLAQADWKVALSFIFMGAGNVLYGQIAKGIIFFLIEVLFVLFMVFLGGGYLAGLVTLGTVRTDTWAGIKGDNSIVFMLMGILTIFAIILFVVCYTASLKSALRAREAVLKGNKPRTFMEDIAALSGRSFPAVALVVPLLGVALFSVLPIVMTILVAFTNYGGTIQVPAYLVDYVGFENFVTIFSATNIGETFFRILGWNILWAFLSTFVNYFLGLGLALLLSKKCVKGKAFWRAFPILAYAIPGFITLIAFKFMFSVSGPLNYYITSGHLYDDRTIDFLGMDSTWSARSTKTNWSARRTVWSISSRSLALAAGRMTVLIPLRKAAMVFSFSPPMGSTRPRRVTSPVMAIPRRTEQPVRAETMAVVMAMPAEGPSLGTAPSGKWTWMSFSL